MVLTGGNSRDLLTYRHNHAAHIIKSKNPLRIRRAGLLQSGDSGAAGGDGAVAVDVACDGADRLAAGDRSVDGTIHDPHRGGDRVVAQIRFRRVIEAAADYAAHAGGSGGIDCDAAGGAILDQGKAFCVGGHRSLRDLTGRADEPADHDGALRRGNRYVVYGTIFDRFVIRRAAGQAADDADAAPGAVAHADRPTGDVAAHDRAAGPHVAHASGKDAGAVSRA